MDKVAKVKTEIERLKKAFCCNSKTDVELCLNNVLGTILSFIDSLSEESVSNIWHKASENPPIGQKICILWSDGLITIDTWNESDKLTNTMRYWCLSSKLLPIDNKTE